MQSLTVFNTHIIYSAQNMTQQQLNILTDIKQILDDEIDLCLHKSILIANALCDLPEMAASGEFVTHGANCVIGDILDYWLTRLALLKVTFDVEQINFRINTINKVTPFSPILLYRLGKKGFYCNE